MLNGLSSTTTFSYQPLDASLKEIRLIKKSAIESPQDADGIYIEMNVSSLNDKPRFIALSYAWGEPTKAVQVVCNQKSLKITRNLSRALRTVFCAFKMGKAPGFQRGDEALLWVDGICINQDDNDEKSSQVPLMKDIFGTARGVIGYIGAPQNSEPTAAFQSLAKLGNALLFNSEHQSEHVPMQIDHVALGELLCQPWFQRSWVFQEVVLPSHVMCLYGDGSKQASWSLQVMIDLVDRMQHITNPNASKIYVPNEEADAWNMDVWRNNLVIVDSWGKLRTQLQETPAGLNPVMVATHYRRSDATDKRDKVYAMLGLLSNAHRHMIRVDYSAECTLLQRYCSFAGFCIYAGYGIELLENAGISPNIPDLPSWAPDWSYEPRYPLYSSLYRCTGTSEPVIRLWPNADPAAISVRGAIVDVINSVGFACSYNGSPPNPVISEYARSRGIQLDENLGRESLIVYAEEIARQMCAYIQRRIPAYSEVDFNDIIWRTLTGDRSRADRNSRTMAGDRRYYDAWCKLYRDTQRDDGDQVDKAALRQAAEHFKQSTTHMMLGRMLCTTLRGGILGVVPNDSKPGDLIAVLLGGNVPFVLRLMSTESCKSVFRVVGTAYAHGIMNGELFNELADQDPIIITDLVLK